MSRSVVAPAVSSLREIGAQALEPAVEDDPLAVAVFFFGSRARGEARPDSDVDLCVVLHPDAADKASLLNARLRYASVPGLDVSVFQLLPVYVRRRVLAEGRSVWVRDEDALYEAARRTTREWELFRPDFEMHLAEIARAR